MLTDIHVRYIVCHCQKIDLALYLQFRDVATGRKGASPYQVGPFGKIEKILFQKLEQDPFSLALLAKF